MRHLASPLARATVVGLLVLATGCSIKQDVKPRKSPYPQLGVRKDMPAYLRDTIFERTDVSNTGPLTVTSFGLVVNLRHSGDTRAPLPVRESIRKEMTRHGIGTFRVPGYRELSPEMMLADKRNAIVMVGAYVPPGARKGQRTDVMVQALPGTDTTSLAGGTLWQCALRLGGANPWSPNDSVRAAIQARGPVFINPAFALEIPKPLEGNAQTGARMGTILGGGICVADRELHLRLRTPQHSIARAIEAVINQRFQGISDKPRLDGSGMCSAEAQDEGYLHLYVPTRYQGNWQHFVGVVNHLYINITPPEAAARAMMLAAEARKPGALMENISYALEGLGSPAVPAINSLLSDPRPAVQFGAARAGAYLNDSASEDALIRITQSAGHPFRINAIQVLGELPYNTEICRAMIACLDVEESLVRTEAYKVLAKNQNDTRIPSPIVSLAMKESFILDVVNCKGAPMIYSTRTGEPRVAIFGPRISVKNQMMFTAFDQQLMLSTHPTKPGLVSIFYRGNELQAPVSTVSRPVVAELVARLAGGTDDKLRFGYGEVVAMLQSFVDSGTVSATWVIQDLPGFEEMADFTDSAANRPIGEPATTRPSQVGVSNGPAGTGASPPRPN